MNARLVAITTILLLVISGCGYNPERDKNCTRCDLESANLTDAYLSYADLISANLTGAKLWQANLTGVVGGDLTKAILE